MLSVNSVLNVCVMGANTNRRDVGRADILVMSGRHHVGLSSQPSFLTAENVGVCLPVGHEATAMRHLWMSTGLVHSQPPPITRQQFHPRPEVTIAR